MWAGVGRDALPLVCHEAFVTIGSVTLVISSPFAPFRDTHTSQGLKWRGRQSQTGWEAEGGRGGLEDGRSLRKEEDGIEECMR